MMNSSDGFDDHGDPLTAPDACSCDTIAATAALQFMSQGEHQTCSSRCQWMAETNSTTVDVDVVHIDA